MKSTFEKQYNDCLDLVNKKARNQLGILTNFVWDDDPRRMTFLFSRYKFVSKMLSGIGSAIEIGCGDAFGSRIVKQEVANLTVSDIDPILIEDVLMRNDQKWPLKTLVHDMVKGPTIEKYDGAYSLDVIEHIAMENEKLFVGNIAKSLSENGIAIIGSPSLNSQLYASEQSKAGHINCKQGPDLKKLFQIYFKNVFLFSMNDEVVHTGYAPMSHYFFVLAVGPK
jgi:2-polyprenyl-3-methyl-5-hydroxy-6-metoxy-1,4-benzoquinol methylase